MDGRESPQKSVEQFDGSGWNQEGIQRSFSGQEAGPPWLIPDSMYDCRESNSSEDSKTISQTPLD